MKEYLVVFTLLIVSPQITIAQTDSISISYVGNMGVLITAGEDRVLIDGLHTFYKKAYQQPPDTLVERLISGNGFGPVNLVLSTHIHADHFSAALTRRYLKENPNGYFVGPNQARDSLVATGVSDSSRIRNPQPEGRSGVSLDIPKYKVTAFSISHANPRRHRSIQNLGYLIELNGKTILHIGDADINPRLFHEIDFATMRIDLAILPDWFLFGNYGPQIVEKFIAPKMIVATHIAPGDPLQSGRQINDSFPEAIIFRDIGQEVVL